MVVDFIPEMLTIAETAKRTGLSYGYIRKLCLLNEITYIRSGTKYLVHFQKFCQFLDNGGRNTVEG